MPPSFYYHQFKKQRNKTPAHYAAKAGNLKTLKLLIEKGALGGILKGSFTNDVINFLKSFPSSIVFPNYSTFHYPGSRIFFSNHCSGVKTEHD